MVDKPTMEKGRDITLDEKLRLLEQLTPGTVLPKHLDRDATLIEYSIPIRLVVDFTVLGCSAEAWVDARIARNMIKKITGILLTIKKQFLIKYLWIFQVKDILSKMYLSFNRKFINLIRLGNSP